MNDAHCTPEKIHRLIDGMLPPDEAESMFAHMGACGECESRYRFLLQFDLALRRLPLTTAGRGFTDSVMAKLDASLPSPRAFRFFTWVAYQLAILIATGIMLGVFLVAGLIAPGQIEAGKGMAGEVVAFLDGLVAGGAGVLTGWVRAALPPVSPATLGLYVVTGAVLLTLLLIDRTITKRPLN